MMHLFGWLTLYCDYIAEIMRADHNAVLKAKVNCLIVYVLVRNELAVT